MGFENPSQSPSDEKMQQKVDAKLEGIERDKFLEKVFASGRTGFYTNFADARFIHRVGWQAFEDVRGYGQQGDRSPIARELAKEIGRGRFSSADEFLKQEGINAVITAVPLIESTTTYREEKETVLEKKGFLGVGKKMVEKVRRIPMGSVDEPEMLSNYTGNTRDAVPAYKIMYYRPDAAAKWAARGRDNSFTASVILPKEVAEEAFFAIQRDPSIMRDILRKSNPDFMKYIEADGQFPPDTKILLVPEGVDAFERDLAQREKPVTGVRKEFVKDVSPVA